MKRSAVIALLLMVGCTNRHCLNRDLTVALPKEWKADSAPDCQVSHELWWSRFEDEDLNALEAKALMNNKDLMIASERILEASSLAKRAFSELFPRVSVNAGVEQSGVLVDYSDFSPSSGSKRVHQESYAIPINLSYEWDFWGKFRAANRAARARLLATTEGYWNVYHTLTTSVATTYFHIRTLDEKIAILQDAIALRESTASIFAARVHIGLDSEIDLSRAKLELALAEQEIEAVKLTRAEAENALATLLGESAPCFSLEKGKLPSKVCAVFPHLPSEVLLNRPDVKEKAHEACAALEEIGVATANLYPSFLLTTSLGLVSPTFHDWFTWKDRFWSAAFQAIQVLFDAGGLCAKKRQREAQYRQAIYAYQKQVEIAFQEVEDALSTIHFQKGQYDAALRACTAAQETADLAKEQFKAGIINYLQVADSEHTQLKTEKRAIELKGSQYLAAVQLIKSLGVVEPFPPS